MVPNPPVPFNSVPNAMPILEFLFPPLLLVHMFSPPRPTDSASPPRTWAHHPLPTLVSPAAHCTASAPPLASGHPPHNPTALRPRQQVSVVHCTLAYEPRLWTHHFPNRHKGFWSQRKKRPREQREWEHYRRRSDYRGPRWECAVENEVKIYGRFKDGG